MEIAHCAFNIRLERGGVCIGTTCGESGWPDRDYRRHLNYKWLQGTIGSTVSAVLFAAFLSIAVLSVDPQPRYLAHSRDGQIKLAEHRLSLVTEDSDNFPPRLSRMSSGVPSLSMVQGLSTYNSPNRGADINSGSVQNGLVDEDIPANGTGVGNGAASSACSPKSEPVVKHSKRAQKSKPKRPPVIWWFDNRPILGQPE
ncbi:hypothetical protein NDU88_003029 [Pleurodeles waltl]|uniref:Uncharacterized protein n=1 Tax=Pleurodeles waltl TaxID=8319 RepID=A0AAV7T5B7_PLEWA|nr:hypothetical protein NDU88_003029 [Pleurodeles waltl]